MQIGKYHNIIINLKILFVSCELIEECCRNSEMQAMSREDADGDDDDQSGTTRRGGEGSLKKAEKRECYVNKPYFLSLSLMMYYTLCMLAFLL